MLLYLSKNKMENLYSEFNINKSFIDSIMQNNIKAELGFKLGITNASIESQHTMEDTNRISQVLKKLKAKNALIELISGETYIKPLNYYICNGTLSYEERIDGHISKHFSKEILDKYRGDSFFSDDNLSFKVKISHDKYQFVDFKCTADSIRVFGRHNLSAYHSDLFKNEERIYHPNSGDPGILDRKLSVRLIFWCLETNEPIGKITGSPLIISC